jgi:hypothetical protein
MKAFRYRGEGDICKVINLQEVLKDFVADSFCYNIKSREVDIGKIKIKVGDVVIHKEITDSISIDPDRHIFVIDSNAAIAVWRLLNEEDKE